MSRPNSADDRRRRLPAVNRILGQPEVVRLVELYGRDLVRVQVQEELAEIRSRLASPNQAEQEIGKVLEELPERLALRLQARVGGALRRVINATGIFLHTNLGRAPLPREVAATLPPLLDAYCDLELELEDGRRGERNRRAESLLRTLTAAPAALVVNNNAGALLLALSTLAQGREVVVSRGELVEIGGSFRIPEIMAAAGVRLVEVGTTNRTRLTDYKRAVGPDTALLLKVYPSNYRMSGFVASVAVPALLELARLHGLPVLVDEGSGLLRPHPRPQLHEHTSLAELMDWGCDVACGSGDKLLGGPQAGLLVGRQDWIRRCRQHPLYRTLRPDRATFAALEGVLRRHLAGKPLPLDRLWPDPGSHRERLERLAAALGADIVAADAFVGGGSAPEAPIPGEALALPGKSELLRNLRSGSPCVMAYLREGRLILDLRTVDPADDGALTEAVVRAQREKPGSSPVPPLGQAPGSARGG